MSEDHRTRREQGFDFSPFKPVNGWGPEPPRKGLCDTGKEIEAICARLGNQVEKTRILDSRISEWLATQLPTVACEFHPDVQRELIQDVQEYRCQEAPAPAYAPCRVCVEDERLKAAGVPACLIHARFESFVPRDKVEAQHLGVVQQFAKVRSGFLLLIGSVGTGKSHLAVASMRAFRKSKFIKQSTLLRSLRATYSDRYADDPVEKCQACTLLVLDDVGLSGGGRDELPMLHEILDFRYGEFLPTILTSNVSADQLRETLGDRLVDRLSECCFAALSFGGISHRKKRKGIYLEAGVQETKAVAAPRQRRLKE